MSTWRCIVQGCKNSVEREGHVCDECQDAFAGYMVHNPGGHVSTSEEIAAADAALRNAHRQQTILEMGAAPERRRNQICWLCTERRTCTPEEMGWECDACRGIR